MGCIPSPLSTLIQACRQTQLWTPELNIGRARAKQAPDACIVHSKRALGSHSHTYRGVCDRHHGVALAIVQHCTVMHVMRSLTRFVIEGCAYEVHHRLATSLQVLELDISVRATAVHSGAQKRRHGSSERRHGVHMSSTSPARCGHRTPRTTTRQLL